MAGHEAGAFPHANRQVQIVTVLNSAQPAEPSSQQMAGPSLAILIPTYGAVEKLEVCLESLARYAPADCVIYVLDDATPDDSIRKTCLRFRNQLPGLSYRRSEVNQGFVRTCNWGWKLLRDSDADILLLNSDAEVTAGSLEEMQAVLHLHEKHGVVTPRSNNATVFSIPGWGKHLASKESFNLWERIHPMLPRYQIMPTAIGFCMLIKREVLDRFALFDEIYSPGYNEENDFVCRINRCGYSPVAANWAYVFHYESSSFGARRAGLEAKNRKVLLERYPEYERKVADYGRFHLDPIDRFSSLFVPHKPRILYDLFHLPSKHAGTSDFALNLLREFRWLMEDDCELYVGLEESQTFFANELTGYRLYRDAPSAQMMFDLVYKPCQIFTWSDFRRMNRLAPRVAYTLLDIIAVRCEYLSAPDRHILFRKAAELSDCVFAISEFSHSDFAAYYGVDVPMRIIHLGTNLGVTGKEFRTGEYILILGNAFAHKGVAAALEHLGGEWPVVLLGGEPPAIAPNVRWLPSGNLTRQHMRELLLNARVLVYPSHYEGFGLPVVDALALGKPVVVLDSAVNRELSEARRDKNLYRIASLEHLEQTLYAIFEREAISPRAPRSWRTVGEEYVASFKELLACDIEPAKLRARWDFVRALESVCPG